MNAPIMPRLLGGKWGRAAAANDSGSAQRAPASRVTPWQLTLYAGFAVALAYLAYYLAGRYIGAYPTVFADEQSYSFYSRLAPLGDAIVPSFLYLWVYKLTNTCGNGFLDCARYLNIAFQVGAAPFIYLAARTVAPRVPALLVALVAVAAPSSNYVAFFMPETMYFFGFAVLAWLALARSAWHWAAYAAATGTVLGLMALVKVHAVFLAPSLALFTLYMVWRTRRSAKGLGIAVLAAVVNVGVMFGVKTLVGFLLAGPAALHLLGRFYGEHATSIPFMTLLPAALTSLKGHLMQLAVLFSMPVAALLYRAASREERDAGGPGAAALMLFTVLMLGAAFMLSVVYTSTIAGLGPHEVFRVHSRYYNFALWLLIAAALAPGAGNPKRLLPYAIALVLAAGLIYSAFRLPLEYKELFVDTPELIALGLGEAGSLAPWVLAAHAVLLMTWPVSRRLAGIGFVAVLMPLFLYNAHLNTIHHVALAHQATPFDIAGRFVQDYLPAEEERNQVRIAGDNHADLMRAQFHVNAPGADLMVLEPGIPMEPYMLPARKRWLLLMGDHALPAGVSPVVSHPMFRLVRTGVDNQSLGVAEFSKPLPDAAGLLTGAEGLSAVEPWGRWSDSPQVTLHFAKPLPARLNLFLTMQAFGPNAGKDVVVRVGDTEKRIKVQPAPSEIYVAFDTDGTQRSVTIVVPEPVTPKSLGHGVDERTLGLGLLRVEVGRR